MRIVATSDTHYYVPKELIPEGDVLFVAGDLMYSGQVDEWAERKRWLAEQPHKHKYFIPGNHDFHAFLYAGVARAELRRECNVKMIMPSDPIFRLPNGMLACGLPFVTGLDGWAYNMQEEQLDDYLEALFHHIEGVDVMITHAPMYRVLDAIPHFNGAEHAGCMAYNRWFYRRAGKGLKLPLLWFCGHIHEGYGHTNINGTQFYNVSLCDRKYEQVNPPVVIDL